MDERQSETNQLREKGNEAFVKEDYSLAIDLYTKAIDTSTVEVKDDQKAIQELINKEENLRKCFNNRAQCYLKVKQFKLAIEDASKVLMGTPNDEKGLYRRAQAYRELNLIDEALIDGLNLLRLDTSHKHNIAFVQNLTAIKAKKEKKCGLCGKSDDLTKTRCCKRWICNDPDDYKPFSFSRVSCFRNHDMYTLCSIHDKNKGPNKHKGKWLDCRDCRNDYPAHMFVYYATNEHNFEKMPHVQPIELACETCCFKSTSLEDFPINFEIRGKYSFFCAKNKCQEAAKKLEMAPFLQKDYNREKDFQTIMKIGTLKSYNKRH